MQQNQTNESWRVIRNSDNQIEKKSRRLIECVNLIIAQGYYIINSAIFISCMLNIRH